MPALSGQTKGKVERPFRYIREDFFLGRSFRILEDLNTQFGQWLDQVANVPVQATTGGSWPSILPKNVPSCSRFRRGRFSRTRSSDASAATAWSRSAAISTACPTPHAGARSKCTARPTRRAFSRKASTIAVHPVLDGRGQRRIIAGHRSLPARANTQTPRNGAASMTHSGEIVALRPLASYDAVGMRLAAKGAAA